MQYAISLERQGWRLRYTGGIRHEVYQKDRRRLQQRCRTSGKQAVSGACKIRTHIIKCPHDMGAFVFSKNSSVYSLHFHSDQSCQSICSGYPFFHPVFHFLFSPKTNLLTT